MPKKNKLNLEDLNIRSFTSSEIRCGAKADTDETKITVPSGCTGCDACPDSFYGQ